MCRGVLANGEGWTGRCAVRKAVDDTLSGDIRDNIRHDRSKTYP